jgi:hypothetical protein
MRPELLRSAQSRPVSQPKSYINQTFSRIYTSIHEREFKRCNGKVVCVLHSFKGGLHSLVGAGKNNGRSRPVVRNYVPGYVYENVWERVFVWSLYKSKASSLHIHGSKILKNFLIYMGIQKDRVQSHI